MTMPQPLNSGVATAEFFVKGARSFDVRGASTGLRAFEDEHFFTQATTSTVTLILYPEASL